MKISCYRMRERRPFVEVIEVAELDVNLAHAVEEEFGPLEELGDRGLDLPYRRRRPGMRYRRHRRAYDPVPGPVALRGPGKHDDPVRFDGLVVYKSTTALIDFLLSRWHAGGTGELDGLLRTLRQGRLTQAQRRVKLEAFLQGTGDRRKGKGPPLAASDSIDLRHGAWFDIEEEGHTYYCRSRSEALAVAIERAVQVRGISVPHHEWLVLGTGRNEQALHIDRGVTRRYNGLRELPDSVYRRFDEHGRAWPTASRGQVPLSEMWPRFLLRVPDRFECKDVVAGPDERLPPCFLLEPKLLSDPDRLTEDLPLIDDPEAVRAVLARTVGGVYLPGNPPVFDIDVPDTPLLVGALPGQERGP